MGEKCRGYKSAEHDDGSNDALSRQPDIAMIQTTRTRYNRYLYVFVSRYLLGKAKIPRLAPQIM